MATTRPSVRPRRQRRGPPTVVWCMSSTTTGSSTSSWGSAGPLAVSISPETSSYHSGAPCAGGMPSHNRSAALTSNWTMSIQISSRADVTVPARALGLPVRPVLSYLSLWIVVTRGDDRRPVGSVQGPTRRRASAPSGLPSDLVDAEAVRRRVAEARAGRLATVTPSGLPHIVPCCFVLEGDTVYSAVDHKPKSTLGFARLDNLRATGVASLLVDHYEEDWTRPWWVRLDGTGRVEEGGDIRERALGLLA